MHSAVAGEENAVGGSMKLSRTKIIIAGLLITLVAAVALSQTVKRAHMHGGGEFGLSGHMLGFFTDYLNLTDAQQSQIKEIMAKEQPTIQPFMDQLKQSHHELRQLAESGSFDEAKVRSLASQQSQTMTELIVQKTRIESELFQVLTPEQNSKMQEFMNRHEQRFMKHMHEGMSGD
jgi:Spy/CpxP family protein refolding chaperone